MASFVASKIQKVKLRTSNLDDEDLDKLFNARYLDDILPELDTGDILLFRGNGAISKVIKKLTLCCFSHVAMVLRNPSKAIREKYEIPPDNKEEVFIFESNATTQPPRPGGGTHIVSLRWKLERAVRKEDPNYLLCVRKLTVPGVPREKAFPKLEQFILDMHGISYEMQKLDLLASTTYVGTLPMKEDLSSVFCAELLTACYKHMDLLSPSTNPTNSLPRTFTTSQRLLGSFKIKRDAKLGKEIRIKCNKTREQLEKEFLAANPEKVSAEVLPIDDKLNITILSVEVPNKKISIFVEGLYREQKVKTTTKKTCEWNETFDMTLTNDWNEPTEDCFLSFCVYQNKLPTNQFLGMGYVNLATVSFDKELEIPLNTAGSIKIMIHYFEEITQKK